jgi:uncharacterized membrane protein YjfL (UPF0719 family)
MGPPMHAVTMILAIIAVAATFLGLALEYASTVPDREGSLAVSIVGAVAVALSLASEYALRPDTFEITSRIRQANCAVDVSQRETTAAIAKHAPSAEERDASAEAKAHAADAETCERR